MGEKIKGIVGVESSSPKRGTQMKYFLVVLLSIILLAPLALQGEPLCPIDPNLSSCLFPDHLPAAPESVAIPVTTIGCNPVDMAFVEVQIVLETGNLDQDQQLAASGVTDQAGEVEVVFPEGIRGEGTFHFEVLANGIELCSSVISSSKLSCSTASSRSFRGFLNSGLRLRPRPPNHVEQDQGAVWELGCRILGSKNRFLTRGRM